MLIIIGAEMFQEGLMEIFKMEGELLEFLFLGVYLISMFLIFFKEDLKGLLPSLVDIRFYVINPENGAERLWKERKV